VNDRLDPLFPRDLYGRIALALASAFFGPICGIIAFAPMFGARPRQGVLEGMFLAIVEELFLALFLFFACGLVWALATPRRMERVLEAVTRKLMLALGLFLVPFGILAAWALFVA
jgi:hypothetical protein